MPGGWPMDASDFISALFGTALVVFLVHVLARRLTKDAASVEQTKPGMLGRGIYYVAKWITIIGFVYLVVVYLPNYFPPRWVERISQRKQVAERVQSAGGWGEVLRQSSLFVSTNADPRLDLVVPWAQTNIVFPPAIKALKPRNIARDSWDGVNILKLHIFGIHSTGRRGPAFYSLVVMPDAPQTNVVDLLRQHYGDRQTIRQITNGVFEVY
jgi:hypothetical protein